MLHGRFDRKDHSKENRQAVLKSPIVAKAVIRLANGNHEIITVFSNSTRLEFYWIFKAKSPRSGRRSWKYAGHEARDFAFSTKPYHDFGSFVTHYARSKAAVVVSLRVPHKRRLASLLGKAAHESIYGDWTVQDPALIKKDQPGRRMLSEGRQLASAS
jgi:hypothetical protein